MIIIIGEQSNPFSLVPKYLLSSSSSSHPMPEMVNKHHHFLIVTMAAQGQINPARHLARRLARTAKARVTIATPLSSHRRLFPKSLAAAGEPDDITEESPLNPDGTGIVAYAPYFDGFGDGTHPNTIDPDFLMEMIKSHGSRTLAAMTSNFSAGGRPVTCIMYTILLTWATNIARDLGVPAIHFWIQPASVFAIYYYYFHDHPAFAFTDSSSSLELPGLPCLRLKDLPSIITTPNAYLSAHMDIFVELSKSEKPIVLLNTFDQLEAPVIDQMPGLELFTIGPIVDKRSVKSRDLFNEDMDDDYMEWLDKQDEGSVVYVAFGSLTRFSRQQVEELDVGLKESGVPYLWVLRKDSRPEGVLLMEGKGKGKVVQWCSQVRVLEHKAVGCFVTHGGWNSTFEAVASGVPMVMIPQRLDQATNARLVEVVWGIGVRLEEGEDGVVEAAELRRGLEVVMGEGERGREIRRKAEEWKEKAREAVEEEGSSSRNLKAFVNSL